MASFFGPGGIFSSSRGAIAKKGPAETEAEVNEYWAGLTSDQRQSVYNYAIKRETRLPEKFRNYLELEHEPKWVNGVRVGLADWVLEMDLSRMIQSFYNDGVSYPVKYKENPAEKALIYSIFRENLVYEFGDRMRLLRNLNTITNRDGSEGHAKLVFKDIKGISNELLDARIDFLREEKKKAEAAGATWGSVSQPGKSNRRKSLKDRK
jgi:hypothetical protein